METTYLDDALSSACTKYVDRCVGNSSPSRGSNSSSTNRRLTLNRRAFLLLPLTLASYSMLRESRLVGLVDRRSATSVYFAPQQQQLQQEEQPQPRNVTELLPYQRNVTEFTELLPYQRNITERPEVVWLASYPNSGTSYTMTLVERASNLSTATNYGVEVTASKDTSLPLHESHPEGPFWEGLHGRMGRTIRPLPDKYVLTKTHCGGRCLHCGASRYVVDTPTFVQGCLRTSYLVEGKRLESNMTLDQVSKLVHLIRNPLHNVVARYHLDRRHFVSKNASLAQRYPNNAKGFHKWCHELDHSPYASEVEQLLDVTTRHLMLQVPCRGEFYKYTMWHQHTMNMAASPQQPQSMLSSSMLDSNNLSSQQQQRYAPRPPLPVLVIHYENYQRRFNDTVQTLMGFIQQDIVSPLRPFRALPTYQDHYTPQQVNAIRSLIQHVASPQLWQLLQHYFDPQPPLPSSLSPSELLVSQAS